MLVSGPYSQNISGHFCEACYSTSTLDSLKLHYTYVCVLHINKTFYHKPNFRSQRIQLCFSKCLGFFSKIDFFFQAKCFPETSMTEWRQAIRRLAVMLGFLTNAAGCFSVKFWDICSLKQKTGRIVHCISKMAYKIDPR